MAGDGILDWLTSGVGLILISAAIGFPFLIWRIALGEDFDAIGFKPLAFAYLAAGIGLVLMNSVGRYFDFSEQVASGLLAESQRWSVVPGWILTSTILLLLIVLPLLGVLGVPLAAVLLKRGLLTPRNIVLGTMMAWLGLSGLAWAFPDNEWHRTHRLESFITWLKGLLPGVLFVGLPFVVAIYRRARSVSRA